jgi:hypothetical protein
MLRIMRKYLFGKHNRIQLAHTFTNGGQANVARLASTSFAASNATLDDSAGGCLIASASTGWDPFKRVGRAGGMEKGPELSAGK